MKLATTALIALVLAAPAAAQQHKATANNPQDLINIEAAWAKAEVARDGAALGRILAPDFKSWSRTGAMRDRAATIKDATGGDEKLTSMVNHDLHVTFLGADHAIVQGQDSEAGVKKGKAVKEVYSWTDVYARRDGKWVAIASQVSKVK